MLKTTLKIKQRKTFFGRPTNIGKSYGKRESKASLGRKFQRFCGIFNGIRAIAILLILHSEKNNLKTRGILSN